jgi:hypothetical protein
VTAEPDQPDQPERPDRTSQETPVPTAPTAATAQSAPQAGSAADPDALARAVADAVLAHPSVARLHGGRYGDIATYLPGHRLVGVRIGTDDEPVELGVVLHLDRPIPEVVRTLRREVAALSGAAAVDITVGDVELPADVAALLRGAPR